MTNDRVIEMDVRKIFNKQVFLLNYHSLLSNLHYYRSNFSIPYPDLISDHMLLIHSVQFWLLGQRF